MNLNARWRFNGGICCMNEWECVFLLLVCKSMVTSGRDVSRSYLVTSK